MNENTRNTNGMGEVSCLLDELEQVISGQRAVVSKFADILSPICNSQHEVRANEDTSRQNPRSLFGERLTIAVETVETSTQILNNILSRLEI